jgi:hypothetical protein
MQHMWRVCVLPSALRQMPPTKVAHLWIASVVALAVPVLRELRLATVFVY